jgi:phosphatidylglycerol:prolipoprotein diacylglycerol transferase
MHPVLFELSFFKVYTYGFFVALAMTAVFIAIAFLAPRLDLPKPPLYDLVLVMFISGVLGARAAYVIQNAAVYAENPAHIFWLKEGGLVWYGGFIVAALASLAYAVFRKLPLLRTADLFAPLLALGHGMGRVGCFFNGCCYGRLTNSPLGTIFSPGDGPRWPTQLFESAFLFVLAGVLTLQLLKRYRQDGKVFLTYLISYSVWRFAIEFLRDDQAMIGPFTVAQWISLALFAGAAFSYFRISSHYADR